MYAHSIAILMGFGSSARWRRWPPSWKVSSLGWVTQHPRRRRSFSWPLMCRGGCRPKVWGSMR